MAPRFPDFFDPHTSAREFLDGQMEQSGALVRVQRFDHVNPDLREKVPEGFVLKEYKTDSEWSEKLRQQLLFNSDHPEDLSWLDKARVLQERQRRITQYFADVLPQLVVKSSFVVGNNVEGKPTIFEIQPCIEGVTVFRITHNQATLDFIVEFFTPEAKRVLKEESKILSQRLTTLWETFQTVGNAIPDFYPSNIVVDSENGHLHLIDTNVESAPYGEEEHRNYFLDRIQKLQSSLDVIILALS